jgi:hypothetical protein
LAEWRTVPGVFADVVPMDLQEFQGQVRELDISGLRVNLRSKVDERQEEAKLVSARYVSLLEVGEDAFDW